MRVVYLMIGAAAILMTSCVSQKKFNDMALMKDRAEIENEQLKKKLQLNQELIGRLQKSDDELILLQKEHGQLRTTHENLTAELKACRERYDDLLENNRRILSSATGEKEALQQELARQQLMLDEKQRELDETERALVERERRLRELTDRMEAQDARLAELKNRISQALLGFSAADLKIQEKNGRVYVTLSQNLLFPKGSRQIDKEGVKALERLAGVLAHNNDFNINVEGHTDPDGSVELNWDLSATRATAVTRILTDNGVNPSRITASGRAFYDPVAPNDTEANKTLNRRTEIILSPRLDALLDIIRQ